MVFNSSYSFWGADNFEIKIKGSLVPYATVVDPEPNGGKRTITVVLRLPEKMPYPGRWNLNVGAVETGGSGGGIGAAAGIYEPIYIHVPYPGYYLDFGINILPVEQNETAKAELVITNRGSNDITDLNLDFNVLNELNESVYSIKKQLADIKSSVSRTDNVEFSTKGIPPGDHKIVASLLYHGSIANNVKQFKIGSRDVRLIEYTKTLEAGKISKLFLTLEVNWRMVLPVYAEALIDGSLVGTSPTLQAGNFGKIDYDFFVDTTSLAPGDHNLVLKIHFGSDVKHFNEKIKLTSPAADKIPEKENPAALSTLTIVLIVAVSIALLAVFALIVVLVIVLPRLRK